MDATVATWLIGGLCVLANFVITTVIATLIKRWFDAKDKMAQQREEERKQLEVIAEQQKAQQMQEMMDARCNLQIKTIREEMTGVSKQLGVFNDSVCAGLRDDLLNSYWRCHDWQKFRTGWDTENMEDLYKSYKKMGGNSFIDHLMEEFYKIPLQ